MLNRETRDIDFLPDGSDADLLSGKKLVQFDLEGRAVAPWEAFGCCEACWTAKEEKCVCKCKGANHGRGVVKAEEKGKTETEKGVEAQLEDLKHNHSDQAAQVYKTLVTDFKCSSCGYDLKEETVLHYDHSAGWPVEGRTKKQWLFITCPSCGYQNALWKLGVPRTAALTTEAVIDSDEEY